MYYYYCTMWYGAEVILLFFQESWLEALKTRVALQGLNHAYFSSLYILLHTLHKEEVEKLVTLQSFLDT